MDLIGKMDINYIKSFYTHLKFKKVLTLDDENKKKTFHGSVFPMAMVMALEKGYEMPVENDCVDEEIDSEVSDSEDEYSSTEDEYDDNNNVHVAKKSKQNSKEIPELQMKEIVSTFDVFFRSVRHLISFDDLIKNFGFIAGKYVEMKFLHKETEAAESETENDMSMSIENEGKLKFCKI